MDIHDIHSLDDLVMFINRLSGDVQENKDNWQNLELHDYLASVSAWLSDSEGKFLEAYDNPYKKIAAVLYAGKIYE